MSTIVNSNLLVTMENLDAMSRFGKIVQVLVVLALLYYWTLNFGEFTHFSKVAVMQWQVGVKALPTFQKQHRRIWAILGNFKNFHRKVKTLLSKPNFCSYSIFCKILQVQTNNFWKKNYFKKNFWPENFEISKKFGNKNAIKHASLPVLRLNCLAIFGDF